MQPDPAALVRLRDLYAHGRYRQALEAASAFSPPRSWTGTPARLLGGRLVTQLGAPRLGRRLHAAAFRSSPANLEAIYYHARYRFERFGPLAALRFMRPYTDWADASPDLRADWQAFSGLVAARLRDFDRADRLMIQAEQTAPRRAWISVERAAVLESADRTEDALVAARRALELQSWFRPAVQAVAHLLVRSGRETEAIEFLTEACGHLESGIVAAQLAALHLDQNHCVDARRCLDLYAELSPLLEADGRKWLAARRADVAYLLGDPVLAGEQSRLVGEEFYTTFAENLNLPLAGAARIMLPVEVTVAIPPPTVYDVLGRFWQHALPNPPAEAGHPLDGLPDLLERRRAEAAGWSAREFTLTPAAAFALLDAGVPFILTLVEVGVSQPRLVVGYDRVRGSLFLADGHERKPAEAPLAVLLKRYAATGPRGLVLLPPGSTIRLPDLPDANLYERLFQLQGYLLDLKFGEAKSVRDSLVADHPKHRLAKYAAVAWARATAHPVLLLEAMTVLLADYPNDGTLLLTKAAAQRELGRVAERLNLLQEHGYKTDADPLLMQSLAQMLLTDHREQDEADRLLRRSVRVRPAAAAGYYLLASQHWERQQFAEAVELYRIACCLDDREEQFAEAYFRVARATDHVPEALRLFQLKASRAAVPHPPAVKALFNALLDREEPEQAMKMLDKSVEKLDPAHGAGVELRLFRAEAHAQFGRFIEAETDLAAAKLHAPAGLWHKASARVARVRPDLAATREQLEKALDAEPLWAEGHRLYVATVAEAEGKAAARGYVAALAKRFPHVYSVLRLKAEFLTPETEDADAIRSVRDLVDLCPQDAWAWRQLALVQADRENDISARSAIETAGKLEPGHPSYFAVLAHVHRRGGRIDEAIAAYREAIRQNVDHDLAVMELVALSRGTAEQMAAVRFVAEQVHRQPHNGDGLTAYRDQVLGIAARDDDSDDDHGELLEELHGELEKALDERPDLWQSWSLMIQQLGLMQRLEEAQSLAEEATARFPLLAHLWADLARVHAATGQTEDRVAALRSATAAAPGWTPAALELADALVENDDEPEAVRVLERLTARNPIEPAAHVALADRLWNAGESERAVDRATRAVRLDPGFDTAWRMVSHWSDRLDRPNAAADLARDITRTRPGDPRGWLRLARLLHGPEHHVAVLAALDTVIKLDPTSVEAHDLKAERLAEMGRFEAALAAAKPQVLADDMPLVLQGRAAWVEAKRGNYAAAIPPMQALVAVEPEYFWGWQQLAEWNNETGRTAGYLEAAAELCRLKPDHPMPLTLRGEAKLKTGDRSGGKGDLRDALRIAPQYAPAAAILFDACLADGEFRDACAALAVLQEHEGGPEVLVKQIQFACITDDSETALRALAEIAETPGDGPPIAIQLGISAVDVAGWGDRAAAVLKDAWQSGGRFNPWAAIYWLDTPDGESSSYDDRLAAVDAAIAAYPTFAAGYDRKAEMLALVGKFDDAMLACKPTAFGDTIPVTLQGRAAWVEARRGHRAKAIALMKQTVAADPGYLWGWRNLAQWYDADGRPKECLDAADKMVSLAPDDPLARGYRGEARRLVNDRKGAKDDFQTAFDLDPAFDAAGLHLITEQLHAGEIDAAVRTLSRLQEQTSGVLVALRTVQVAARQDNLAAARAKLKLLATDYAAPASVIADAAAAFDAAGWTCEADTELTAAATGPDVTPAGAAVWADRLLATNHGDRVLEALPALYERNAAAGREATLAHAIASARAGRPDTAASTVHRFADQLRADDAAWASAGAALADAGLHALAVNWLSDWKSRDGVEPAMLRPLVAALRSLDRDQDAIAVCRGALELGGEPPADLSGWLALDAVLDGRTAEAAEVLARVDRVGLSDATRLVVAMAEAVAMVQQAGPDGKRAAYADAKDHLRTAVDACAAVDVPAGAGRWFQRVAARLAADSGLLGAKVWAGWQRVRPWVG